MLHLNDKMFRKKFDFTVTICSWYKKKHFHLWYAFNHSWNLRTWEQFTIIMVTKLTSKIFICSIFTKIHNFNQCLLQCIYLLLPPKPENPIIDASSDCSSLSSAKSVSFSFLFLSFFLSFLYSFNFSSCGSKSMDRYILSSVLCFMLQTELDTLWYRTHQNDVFDIDPKHEW